MIKATQRIALYSRCAPRLCFLLGLTGLLAGPMPASAQGTAFTYQGHLTDGGLPANGNYDFSFGLYPTNTGGNSAGGVLTNTSVAVSNGLFTAVLDFGPVLDGTTYWLEIGVQPAGGTNGFSVLSSRQALTPTPYAVYAANAGTVAGVLATTNLPASVALLDTNATFAGTITAPGFAGNGAGLTNLTPGSITNAAGFWAAAPAGGNASTNAAQNWTDAQQLTSPGNTFVGTLSTNGFNAVNLGPVNTGAIVEDYPGATPWELVQRAYVPNLPIATFRPLNPGAMVIDLMPNGNASDTGYGTTWFDMCSQDCITDNPAILQCIHLATHTTYQEISTVAYLGSPLPLQFGSQPIGRGGSAIMTLDPINFRLGLGTTTPAVSFENYTATGNLQTELVNNNPASAFNELAMMQSATAGNGSGGRIFLFNNAYSTTTGGANNSTWLFDAAADVTNGLSYSVEAPKANFRWYVGGYAAANEAMVLSSSGVLTVSNGLSIGTNASLTVDAGGNLTTTGTLTGNSGIWLRTNAVAPAPQAWGGFLWNSNNALYWVTTRHTNYIAGP